jgi:ribosomal protein L11 methyltransferase
MKTWFAIEVTVNPRASEAIEVAFNNLNSLGSEINNLHKTESEDVCVIGYFDKKIDDHRFKAELDNSLRIYGLTHSEVKCIELKTIENQDWLSEWKKHWKPTETDRFIVAPTWAEINNSKKVVIRIEPNMAFGTGTHETTKLCLRAIENYYESGMSFFDVGTGTGILAIAVSKIDEEDARIRACDIDHDSVRIAMDNASLNNANQI